MNSLDEDSAANDGGAGDRKPQRSISLEIGSGVAISIMIQLNTAALHDEIFPESCTLEEHIIVYNRRCLDERYYISLQLETALPGAALVKSLHVSMLEGIIINFMQDFAEIWHEIAAECQSPSNDQNGRALIDDHGHTDEEVSRLLEFIETLTPERAGEASGGEVHDSRPDLKALYSDLFFQYCYITDQLVFYAHHKNDTDSSSHLGEQRLVLKLATLQYSFVFQHRIFTHLLSQNNRTAVARVVVLQWTKQFLYFMSHLPVQTPATELLFETKRALEEICVFQ